MITYEVKFIRESTGAVKVTCFGTLGKDASVAEQKVACKFVKFLEGFIEQTYESKATKLNWDDSGEDNSGGMYHGFKRN